MPGVSNLAANLALVCLENVLYGIFFVLCLTSIFLLGRRRRFPSPNVRTYTHPVFVGTVLLALSITAHWLLTDIRLFQALIYFEGGTEPVLFLGDLSQATKIAQTATLVLSVVFIFDAMMIYRVWVVWSYSIYVTVFPMLCWIVYAVCGSIMLYHSSLYKLGSDVFDMPIGDWMTALCVFMICHEDSSSIYSTVMIALRICQTSLRIEIFGKEPAMRAIAVFIESAALYAQRLYPMTLG
ncbi:hypothetical protein EVJ58_g7150 [Rhodofomes roseus]|uniref:Uncharacterized protein n=1 Tax=Rhodofomes roseus TaxID=34475 RepID=A0A4Y9Y6M8_9APHY|nr:hypothetical protein EVJ58_g7150 [Rhodofomes roseus]